MKIIILSGIPGCGKTRYAQGLSDRYAVVSADDYLPKDPKPDDFSQAHRMCFQAYLAALRDVSIEGIVVDNTNLNAWEISPYYLAANNNPIEVRRIHFPEEECFKRQTHGVPFATFCIMVANFKKRDVLPWWTVYEQR